MNINDKHPADIAEELSQLDPKDRNISFLLLSSDKKADVFPYFESDVQQKIIKSLGDKDFSEMLNNLDPDDRTSILESFPDYLIKDSINLLDEKEKEIALNLIGYPKDCIARLMTPQYVQAKSNWTVAQVLNNIKKYGKNAETLTYVYVVDKDNKLIDDLKIGQLLMADSNTPLSELMDNNFVSIKTTTPMEDGFHIFEKYDRSALPITTENNTLVGIVTFDDILDKIKERDTEDIQKFGGVEGLDLSYTNTPLLELVKKRAGWLLSLIHI